MQGKREGLMGVWMQPKDSKLKFKMFVCKHNVCVFSAQKVGLC